MPESSSQYFETLRAELSAVCGARLFTVTAIDAEHGLARRIFTSHPAEYPTSGTKPIQHDQWTRQVIVDQQPFVANSTAEFAIYFPDHALINAVGCQSALNIPVVDAGNTVATVNILDVAGRFDGPTVGRVEEILKRHHSRLVAAVRSGANQF